MFIPSIILFLIVCFFNVCVPLDTCWDWWALVLLLICVDQCCGSFILLWSTLVSVGNVIEKFVSADDCAIFIFILFFWWHCIQIDLLAIRFRFCGHFELFSFEFQILICLQSLFFFFSNKFCLSVNCGFVSLSPSIKQVELWIYILIQLRRYLNHRLDQIDAPFIGVIGLAEITFQNFEVLLRVIVMSEWWLSYMTLSLLEVGS